jgi:hypothetical protein
MEDKPSFLFDIGIARPWAPVVVAVPLQARGFRSDVMAVSEDDADGVSLTVQVERDNGRVSQQDAQHDTGIRSRYGVATMQCKMG